jgi:hypothetical protein
MAQDGEVVILARAFNSCKMAKVNPNDRGIGDLSESSPVTEDFFIGSVRFSQGGQFLAASVTSSQELRFTSRITFHLQKS